MTLPVLRSPATAWWEPVGRLPELFEIASAWSPPADAALGSRGVRAPLADVVETGDAYLVEIEVPGVRRRDLDVEVVAGELRITGERVEKERVGWLRRRTRRVGRFVCRTALPDDVDTDHISADLTGGVLTVRVPKAEHARARRIPVSVG
jgi:HSP20 family protein